MKSLMVVMASAVFGVAALTGCSSSAADAESSDSSSGTNLADASLMRSPADDPAWLVVEQDTGVYEGYGFTGNIYCPDDTNPVRLTDDVEVEYRDGDLYLSFAGEIPPGVILQSNGTWVVASFNTEGASQYRLSGDIDEKMEYYHGDPTMFKTCWS